MLFAEIHRFYLIEGHFFSSFSQRYYAFVRKVASFSGSTLNYLPFISHMKLTSPVNQKEPPLLRVVLC